MIFQLSQFGESGWPTWHDSSFIMRALYEEDQKPNPVVQRVKVIMSAGLMLVHAHRYSSLQANLASLNFTWVAYTSLLALTSRPKRKEQNDMAALFCLCVPYDSQNKESSALTGWCLLWRWRVFSVR